MRRLRTGSIGSISAWLPSRRSTEHQSGALSMVRFGHVRSRSTIGTYGAVLLEWHRVGGWREWVAWRSAPRVRTDRKMKNPPAVGGGGWANARVPALALRKEQKARPTHRREPYTSHASPGNVRIRRGTQPGGRRHGGAGHREGPRRPGDRRDGAPQRRHERSTPMHSRRGGDHDAVLEKSLQRADAADEHSASAGGVDRRRPSREPTVAADAEVDDRCRRPARRPR